MEQIKKLASIVFENRKNRTVLIEDEKIQQSKKLARLILKLFDISHEDEEGRFIENILIRIDPDWSSNINCGILFVKDKNRENYHFIDDLPGYPMNEIRKVMDEINSEKGDRRILYKIMQIFQELDHYYIISWNEYEYEEEATEIIISIERV